MPVSSLGSTQRALSSRRRAQLLGLLQASSAAMCVAELASNVGLHGNTVRSHLDVLVRSGHVVRSTDARGGPGRPREVYRPTGAPLTETNYKLLAEVLTHHVRATSEDASRTAQEAGRSWGESNGPRWEAAGPTPTPAEALALVLRMLSAEGFSPELSVDGTAVRLRHCPFRDLAAQNVEIVCRAHLGLVQGVLSRLSGAVVATQILPFIEPELCMISVDHAALSCSGDEPAENTSAPVPPGSPGSRPTAP